MTLRYELAIPLAEDDAGMVNLLALSLIVALLVSALIGVALWRWDGVVSAWLNTAGLRPLLWLLPIALVAISCRRTLTHWAIRRQAFGRITRTLLSGSVGQVATQVGLGFVRAEPLGLVIGQIIGQSAGITTLALAFHRAEGRLWRAITPRGMARAAVRFGKLATLATGAALLNELGVFLPAILIAALYGAEVAGWYALAHRIWRRRCS